MTELSTNEALVVLDERVRLLRLALAEQPERTDTALSGYRESIWRDLSNLEAAARELRATETRRPIDLRASSRPEATLGSLEHQLAACNA